MPAKQNQLLRNKRNRRSVALVAVVVALAACASPPSAQQMAAAKPAERPVGDTLWTEIIGDPFNMGAALAIEHAKALLKPPRGRPMTRYTLDPDQADNDAYRLVIAVNPQLNATGATACQEQILPRPRVAFQPFTALAVFCKGGTPLFEAKRNIVMPLDPYDPTYALLLQDVMNDLFRS